MGSEIRHLNFMFGLYGATMPKLSTTVHTFVEWMARYGNTDMKICIPDIYKPEYILEITAFDMGTISMKRYWEVSFYFSKYVEKKLVPISGAMCTYDGGPLNGLESDFVDDVLVHFFRDTTL